jgi:hypothetical protein
MDKVRFYKYRNYLKKYCFLVDSSKSVNEEEVVGLIINPSEENVFSIGYFKYKTPVEKSDILLNISLIDFVELLKEHGVPSEIISGAIKQIEEWN